MAEFHRRDRLSQCLADRGSDLSKWPSQAANAARQALLADPDFRRAWEAERSIDEAMTAMRDGLDAEIARSGAVDRLRRALQRQTADPLAAVGWQRVAAAVLIAGMLGSAVNLMLPERLPDVVDVVVLDAFYEDTADDQ